MGSRRPVRGWTRRTRRARSVEERIMLLSEQSEHELTLARDEREDKDD